MIKKVKSLTKNKEQLRQNKLLKPLSRWLASAKIWHLNKRSVSIGASIGLFFGSLPIPGQMFLSALVSIFLNANIAISIAVTWYSNPFTMPFIFSAQYYLGCYLLDRPTIQFEQLSFSAESLSQLGGNILVPLFLGGVVTGCILAILSLILIRVFWRVKIVKYYHNRQKRK